VKKEGNMVSAMISTLAAVSLLFAPGSAYERQRETDSRESKIDRIFAPLADVRSPGAAVLVRENGRTVFQRGYGVRDLRTQKAIDSQTNFRLASCTKQFTAMAIMLLVHDGKLRYDDHLTDVFPEFPDYGRAITIRNLLNHTSGLPDYEELMDQASGKRPLWTESRQIQDGEVLALLQTQKRGKFAPGTQWSYSNSGYVVLGLVVARISGRPFEDFLHERIFAPLKMNHTLLYVKGKNEIRDRSYGHTKGRSAFAETDQSATSATLGDGGVYSNLEDLAKWDDALTQNALLAANEMQPALTPVKLPDGSLPGWASGPGDTDPLAGRPVLYGFGWFLDSYRGHERMWHYGDTTGFRTAIERFNDSTLTVIVLSNRSDLDPVTLASRVADLYLSPRR
jgi:CubicO group peptidase (beta-lactamase class C family)